MVFRYSDMIFRHVWPPPPHFVKNPNRSRFFLRTPSLNDLEKIKHAIKKDYGIEILSTIQEVEESTYDKTTDIE